MNRPVVGYEGLYEVSASGDIFSLVTNRRLKQGADNRGYRKVELYRGGQRKTVKVHRVVLSAFKENTESLPCINHIDANKTNNNLSNLEWCTQAQNLAHAARMGLIEKHADAYRGENKQTGVVLYFNSLIEAENEGFDGSTICKCCKGNRNSHKGFTWLYESRRRAA